MYTLHFKGKQNPNDKQFVKLEMIFFKTGYARVPKIINITGLLKDWDQKNEIFTSTSTDATLKNKLLLDLKLKYQQVADQWDLEGRNWSPRELAHCFDVHKKSKPTLNKSMSVLQMIDHLMDRFKNKERIKNSHVIDSAPNSKKYKELKNSLTEFTMCKYNRALSSYYFKDIDEQFLLDYTLFIQKKGIENGNKGGLTSKLRRLRALCKHALKLGMYGIDMDIFEVVGDNIAWPETTSKAVSPKVIALIENIDRSLFSKKEQLRLDAFLFSYYTGGMANIDVCYLTKAEIQDDTIVYERIKFKKTAKPFLLDKAIAIIKKYEGTGYQDFVFPIFTHKHNTSAKKNTRVRQFSDVVNQTLKKVTQILKIEDHITWYSARGSFISNMVDQGHNPYTVAEMSGNSPMTIYKHYYKNTDPQALKREMNSRF